VIVRELELDLEAFEGPFDLLLTLVLKEELELRDVDVADIIAGFCEHATRPVRPASPVLEANADAAGAAQSPSAADQERGELDLDASGEFLVLVASLLELKARGLFVAETELDDLEAEEAAEELARRLAEYRRIKEAALWLAERLAGEGDRFFRVGPAPLRPLPERRLEQQDPRALAETFRALAAEPPSVSLAHMELRFPPVSQFLARFRAILGRRSRFDFEGEVEGLSRPEQAVAFLALLELRKAGEIGIEQSGPFAPIRVARAA
jgi:segregation and condensation protein A